jgi:glyoxylate utilization-related uncharacterized protein
MNVKDLDFNLNLKLVSLVPLKLAGYCKTYAGGYKEHHFTILEVNAAYQLIGPNHFDQSYMTLKEALQDCYLNWGE